MTEESPDGRREDEVASGAGGARMESAGEADRAVTGDADSAGAGDADRAVTGETPVEAAADESGLGRARTWYAELTDEERYVTGAIGGFVGLLVVLVALGFLQPSYLFYLLSLAGMYVLLTMGLNVQWGYTGLINFSVAAFFGIGAYGTMLLSSPDSPLLGAGSPVWRWPVVGLLVGVVAGVLLAVLIGVPTLSLREDYLAIATLGLAEVVRSIILNQRDWTDGSAGVIGLPRYFEQWPVVGNALAGVPEQRLNFLTVLVLVLVVWLFLRRVHRSPWGRVQRLVRTDEDLAEALGKDSYAVRMQSFVVGSVIMALAGVFYAHLNNAIFPSNLLPVRTFYVWIAVILGGTGSDRGAILGGIVIITLTEGTRFLAGVGLPVDAGAVRLFLVGALIIALMRYRPEGVLPPQRELVWPPALRGERDE